MIDSVIERIITEVWSGDPRLIVLRVKKWLDKSAILKAIEDRRAPRTSRPESPQRSSGVPQSKSPSGNPIVDVCASTTSSTFVDPSSLKDEGGEDQPTCNLV